MFRKLLILTGLCLVPGFTWGQQTNATQIKDTTGTIWMTAVPVSGLYFPSFTPNKLYYINSSGYLTPVTVGSNLTFTSGTLAATNGGGSVTSVGLTGPTLFTYGSPVTSSGNLSFSLANSVNTANGLVQLNSSGLLPALNASLLTNITPAWSSITGTPTTLAGYGITNALVKTNNLSDLSSISTSRTNLGLGSLAVVTPSGTAGANTWLNYNGSTYSWLQPAFSNLSGSIAIGQIPTGTTSSTVAIGNDSRFPATVTGIRKSGGTGSTDTAAVSGVDYAPATSGSFILAGNGSGGHTNVTVNRALNYASGTTLLYFQRQVNAQSGTTYTLLDADQEKLVTFNNIAPVAVSLAQAGASSQFVNGWHVTLINKGAGTVTITPTTSTINGNTSTTLTTGYTLDIWSDGTNYQASNTAGTTSAYSLVGNSTSTLSPPTSLQSGIILGTPGFTDSGVGIQQTKSVNGYFQNILQNTSTGTAASADFILGNNNSTSSTYYGDFGINGGNYTGTGSLALPNATYLYSQTGDLVLGTDTANALHFVYNNGATDSLTINSSGLTVPSFSTAGLITNSSAGLLSSTTESNWLDTNFSNAQGTLLYRGASGWSALAPGTSGYILTTGGSGANPTWMANAGLTNPMTLLGDTIYGGSSGSPTRLAGYTTANQAVLAQTGTGSVSAAPAWTNSPSLSAVNMSQGSSSAFGVFKVDGSSMTSSAGVLSASNLIGTPTLPNGTSATTQSSGDTSGKLATDSFVATSFAPLVSPTFLGTPSLPTGTTAITQTSTDNSNKLATTAFVQTALGGSTTAAPAYKNRIINGDMRIDQRTATTTVTSTPSYVLMDRWYSAATGANLTISQATNPGQNFQYALQLAGNTSNTGFRVCQEIEAANIYDLAGSSTCTVSCYAASNSLTSLTMTVYTATGGTDTWTSRSAVSVKTWTISPTLTQYTYTFAFSSDTNGVSIEFTGGALTSGNTFTLTGVQLESGSNATTFERTPISQEYLQCQRYFYQIGGVASSILADQYTTTANAVELTFSYPTPMRIAPAEANVGTINLVGCATQTVNAGVYSANVYYNASGTGVASWNNAAGAYLTFSAELTPL